MLFLKWVVITSYCAVEKVKISFGYLGLRLFLRISILKLFSILEFIGDKQLDVDQFSSHLQNLRVDDNNDVINLNTKFVFKLLDR